MKKFAVLVVLATMCFSVYAQQNKDVKLSETKNNVIITKEPSYNGKVEHTFDLNFVGCYGDSKTNKVYLVIKVKDLESDKIYIGKTKAVTSKGKLYTSGCGDNRYDCIKDFDTEINLEKCAIEGVPTTVTDFADFQVSVKNITCHFRNVPILWDVKPEE